MHKNDALTSDQLTAKGYTLQPDCRLRLRTSWKSQCKRCEKWFSRVAGNYCWTCYDHLRNEHVWAIIKEQKARANRRHKS